MTLGLCLTSLILSFPNTIPKGIVSECQRLCGKAFNARESILLVSGVVFTTWMLNSNTVLEWWMKGTFSPFVKKKNTEVQDCARVVRDHRLPTLWLANRPCCLTFWSWESCWQDPLFLQISHFSLIALSLEQPCILWTVLGLAALVCSRGELGMTSASLSCRHPLRAGTWHCRCYDRGRWRAGLEGQSYLAFSLVIGFNRI